MDDKTSEEEHVPNKAEFVDQLAQRLDGDRKRAAAALDAVIDNVYAAIDRGERVAITGFGVFERRTRAARTGRNPATGASVQVPASRVPAFRAGAEFKKIASGAPDELRRRSERTREAVDSAFRVVSGRAAGVVRDAQDRAAGAVRDAVGAVTSVTRTPVAKSARKSATKSTAKKSTPAKKSTAKKSTAKKSSPAKKSTAKKSTAKKSTAKKSTAKKSTAKKSSPAKKTAAKKSPAKKSAKKAPAKKR